MSALAMILTAAMMVPGDGPKIKSGEVEQRLDLSGEWEGVNHSADRTPETTRITGFLQPVRDEGCTTFGSKTRFETEDGMVFNLALVFVDQGSGHLEVRSIKPHSLGIYRKDGDSLLICSSQPGDPRSTDFLPRKGRDLLILRRVKPRK